MNWVKPANLAEQRIREQPNGQIYSTITYGLNNMKGYAAQISRDDRWAIVAYVRALQLSQSAALESLPGDVRAQLEQQPR
jgi:mono/diheme cytochrome c family protein